MTGRAFGYGDERRPSQKQLVAMFGATEPNSLEVRFSNGSSVASTYPFSPIIILYFFATEMKQAFEKNDA